MNRALLRLISIGLLLLLLIVTYMSLRTLRRLPSVTVYFIKSSPTTFSLEPVTRLASTQSLEGQLNLAIQTLITGPSENEAAQGLSSSFPEATRLLGLELSSTTAEVNLSQAFEQGGGSATMIGRINQLFYTLTELEEISNVSLLIEGKPILAFSAQGLLIENPWQRSGEALPRW